MCLENMIATYLDPRVMGVTRVARANRCRSHPVSTMSIMVLGLVCKQTTYKHRLLSHEMYIGGWLVVSWSKDSMYNKLRVGHDVNEGTEHDLQVDNAT